jgi:hypothetical protein
MRHGLEMVDIAYDLIDKQLGNKDVKKICDMLLGDDAAKIAEAKGIKVLHA